MKQQLEAASRTVDVLQDLLKERQDASAAQQAAYHVLDKALVEVAPPDVVQRIRAKANQENVC